MKNKTRGEIVLKGIYVPFYRHVMDAVLFFKYCVLRMEGLMATTLICYVPNKTVFVDI